MRPLANHAVLVRRTVHMDVHYLDRGAKQEKDGDYGNKQKTRPRFLRPEFTESSHNSSLYLTLLNPPNRPVATGCSAIAPQLTDRNTSDPLPARELANGLTC